MQKTIARAAQSLIVTRLMELAANAYASQQIRLVATEALRELRASLRLSGSPRANNAYRNATEDDIERFLARPDATRKQNVAFAGAGGRSDRLKVTIEVAIRKPTELAL